VSQVNQPIRSKRLISRTAVTLGVLVLVLTSALAANAASTGAAKTGGLTVKLTQDLFQTFSTGNPPATGSNSAVGTSDGQIGRTIVHGTVRGTNVYPAFTGKWVMFDPNGTISFSLTGHVVATGKFAGTAKVSGGTGKYRHAGGKLTFTAHVQQPTHGESSLLIVRSLTGTLVVP
jgi:hypothetical protein